MQHDKRADIDRRLRFALFGNEFQSKKSTSVQLVLQRLKQHNAEIYVDKPYYDYLTMGLGMDVRADGLFEGYNVDADYAVSVGGDGTFLKTANRVLSKHIPVLGVNTGRLGFLAEVLPSEFEQALNEIYSGECTFEEHTVIQMDTQPETELSETQSIDDSPYALNDIAILKRDSVSMITIRAFINGDFLMTYQADGLIVSTPTGSTAYNLSNGGPIIVPQSGSLCITPVAPHSLNVRPIVINDTSVVQLVVESRSHNFLVAIDGRSERFDEGTPIIIRKAPYTVRVVKLQSKRYFSILREKLMWGADQRG